MAVFRIEKTRDYTVMSNHHLRNAGLSLKSKGLLSMMLSLPENWNYTTRGLAKICKEGTDSIGSALKELERAGYIVRNRLRDSKGKIVDVEYVIYETPHPPDTGQPCEDEPDTACPDTGNPDMDNPCLENRPQLNKEKRNPEEKNTHSPSTEGSNPFRHRLCGRWGWRLLHRGTRRDDPGTYRGTCHRGHGAGGPAPYPGGQRHAGGRLLR